MLPRRCFGAAIIARRLMGCAPTTVAGNGCCRTRYVDCHCQRSSQPTVQFRNAARAACLLPPQCRCLHHRQRLGEDRHMMSSSRSRRRGDAYVFTPATCLRPTSPSRGAVVSQRRKIGGSQTPLPPRETRPTLEPNSRSSSKHALPELLLPSTVGRED